MKITTPLKLLAAVPATAGPAVRRALAGFAAWALLGASASAITAPTEIPGCALWLDASDAASITQSGGAVAAWANKVSGSPVAAVTATGTAQPTTGASTRNGRNVITFNGTSNHLDAAGGVLAAGDDTFEYFAVWKPATASGNRRVFEQAPTSPGTGSLAAFMQYSNARYGFNGEGNDFNAAPLGANQWLVSGIEFNTDASNNCIVSDQSYPAGYKKTVSAATQNIGADWTSVGWKRSASGEYFSGDLAEFIVFSNNLSAADRAAVRDYLAAKWGVSTGLVHRWSFNDGTANDSIGSAHGTLYGNTTPAITGGKLELNPGGDQNQHMATAAFTGETLSTRTLVAWVSLSNLGQPGGAGVLGIQPSGVDNFDSIVYGERVARQWMNGSNGWARTIANNGGTAETSTDEVMMAIVYDGDNSIKLYRNGARYDTGANQGTLVTRTAPIAVLGRRLSTTTPSLQGAINEARIYNRALTDVEIQTLNTLGPDALPTVYFEITASADFGGTISPSGITVVEQNTTPTYTITPAIGYNVADVVVDAGTGSEAHLGAVTTYTFSPVTAAHTISATFVAVDPHTVTASAGTNGSIDPPGAVSVDHRDSQTYTIMPDTGYMVADVVLDAGTGSERHLGSVTTYTFANVQADRTISATFTPALTYDFNDGTFQDWQVVSQGGGPNLLVTASWENRVTTAPCLTTSRSIAGGAFTGDNPHAMIIARSPLFTINAGATEIKWNTVAGHAANTVNPGTGTGAYPAGALGISLVEAATGNRIMSDRLSVQATATTKSFSVSSLAGNGTNYYLEIVDNFSGGWGYGEWDEFLIPGTLAAIVPPAPAGLGAVAGNAKVVLTWTASLSATSYNVKRSQTNGGPYTLLGTSTATTYLDTTAVNGTSYYYVVSATGTAGEGDNSTQADATPNILPLPSGTAVYYSFNDAANLGRDDSGKGQHLQAATGTPQHDTGGYGGALLLDGATTLGTVSGSFPTGVPTGANPYTVACFVKADPASSTNGGWIGYGTNGTALPTNFMQLV